ncbi:MAG: type II secretion system protein [Thermodesulfobacteriota bacterium]
MNKRGWTLIETMIMVAIIGIVLAVIIPKVFPDKKAQLERQQQEQRLEKEKVRTEENKTNADYIVTLMQGTQKLQIYHVTRYDFEDEGRIRLTMFSGPDKLLVIPTGHYVEIEETQ